jgi:hypothetical protein
VFDSEPPWEREDLDRLARAAPLPISFSSNPGGTSAQRSDVVTALSPRMVSASPGEQTPDTVPDTAF